MVRQGAWRADRRDRGRGWSARCSASDRPPVRRAAAAARATRRRRSAVAERRQFFRATFQAMGHIAKADGRVSEHEIGAARAVMRRFRSAKREVQLAIELFTQGKTPRLSARRDARANCARLSGRRPDLWRMFVQISCRPRCRARALRRRRGRYLSEMCQALGVSALRVRLARGDAANAGKRASERTRSRAAPQRHASPMPTGARRGAIRVRRGGHEGVSPADEPESSRTSSSRTACRNR